MPSDQELLAIAREVMRAKASPVLLDDVAVSRHGIGECYFSARRTVTNNGVTGGAGDVLAQGDDIIEVIYAARQKLAAEREAARTPEERRLREKIARIRKYVSNGGEWDKTIVRLCNEALEQGAQQ